MGKRGRPRKTGVSAKEAKQLKGRRVSAKKFYKKNRKRILAKAKAKNKRRK